MTEHEGRIVLDPEQPKPRLLERDGFLVIDLGVQIPRSESGAVREERLLQLVEYARRR